MELKRMHWIGIIFGFIIVAIALVFFLVKKNFNLFAFLIGIGIAAMIFPFVVQISMQNKKEQEINERFLEFSRNLAESVATGTPISKSIINNSRKNYGALNPYISKLGNQIELGIPLSKAMQTFAAEVRNPVITRAVSLISEAEKAGGEIENILDSVSKSIAEIEKLKEERKAAIANLVIQGYLIFFIFIGIMLVMEFKILPLALDSNLFVGVSGSDFTKTAEAGGQIDKESISDLFLYLLLVQGAFTGLAIGRLAEDSIKAGIKHSFILAVSAWLIATGLRLFIS